MRRHAVALLGALVLVAAVATVARAEPAPSPPRAVLWGDSLAYEVGDMWRFLLDLENVDTEVHAIGGTAVCDWFRDIEETIERFRPDVVVFTFMGSVLTECTRGPHGEPLPPGEVAANYRDDADRATRIARHYGAAVLWTTGPIPRAPFPWYAGVVAGFKQVASRYDRTAFVDGNRMIAPRGTYAHVLPCLPFEPCDGLTRQTIVRAPDGTHFCPNSVPGLSDGTCDVYSSGALRYSIVLADPVLQHLPR